LRFSQDFIEKVRDANDIVEIIGQYTELKGSGHRLMGRCPFPDHSEKTPSFQVTSDNQLYYCFGCKKGGSAFTFLETYNGMAFPEAVEFLARRASIAIPESDAGNTHGPSRVQKDLLVKVNREAAVFYHHQLLAQDLDSPVRNYLVKRGLNDKTVEKFRLGVALDDWQGLVHHFRARKAPLEAAEELGLIKAKRNSRPDDSHFDLFRDRLIFPIFSATSCVIGFGGRTLSDGTPKYLNSSDSPVFSKSRVLYGIHETGKFIRSEDRAIVVEGYMDAIALYAAGIKNVVAILGTAFTPEHAKTLKRHTLNVVMLLDGDKAGLDGAERSLPILLEAGLMAKGFLLPEKMDPDDFVRAKGAEKLRDEIERAPELFSLLLLRRWMQGYHGSPSEKVSIVEEAGRYLGRMQNRQLYDLYVLELSRQLDVDMGWVRKALATQNLKNMTKPAAKVDLSVQIEGEHSESGEALDSESPAERISLKTAPRDEAYLLSLLLNYENLMVELVDAGTDELLELLSHPGVKRVLELAILRYQSKPESFSGIISALTSNVDMPATLLVAMAAVPVGASAGLERKLLSDYLNAIRKRYLKTQAKALAGQLKEQPSPEKLAEFMGLHRDRLALQREKDKDQ
jgi:DNA primase